MYETLKIKTDRLIILTVKKKIILIMSNKKYKSKLKELNLTKVQQIEKLK